MSSVPPATPPGSVPPPFPPYDSKSQWRIHREQQKAAWRAQREAWKAQHRAMKAGLISSYGPRVPSVVGPVVLIGVGVVALLLLTGRIDAVTFWSWYGHWWPLLLIGAGLALLAEWAIDLFRATPVRRGGSFVGLLVLLGMLGVFASGWTHMRPWFSQMGDQNNWGFNPDFSNVFGQPEHDLDQQVQNVRIPAHSAIDIDNPRGDVSIVPGEEATLQVQAHEVAYAQSDADAKKIFDAVAAHVTVNGSSVKVATASNSNGRVDLTVTVPRFAVATVNAGKGDVTATGLGGGIRVTAHGDVHLDTISGPVEAHFFDGKHDFFAHDVQGDLNLDGDLNDITLSEIKGGVTQNGEILGDVHMEAIHGPVRLRTSVTTLELAKLPGDLTLDSDDLHVNEAEGPVRAVTHSKDVDLNQIYGDSFVEDRDGSISIEPAGAYGVEAKNSKGGIELTLPPSASATVNARTHNGDIVSDYPIPPTQGEDKAAIFQIGSGAAKIVLSADNGDVRINKGPAFPPETSATVANKAASHTTPRLKSHQEIPAQPVTQ